MKTHALPKPLRAAINSKAYEIAHRAAFDALRAELERRAKVLMQMPHSNVYEVIQTLEQSATLNDLLSLPTEAEAH